MLSFQILYNMAKSKSGGTRSYLRGRIASDVYSIGRDASGKKQQVVRSLAEQVKNPQTIAQMSGRMIMSTVMQAVSGLAQLIDHSFDGKPNGQPSISEFISRNYHLIAADAKANPSTNNKFGLNKYQEKGIKGGQYLVSDGDAIKPAAADINIVGSVALVIRKAATDTTAGQIRALLGMGSEDYLTYVGIGTDGAAFFFRVRVLSTLADDVVLTQDNVSQLFSVENPSGLNIAITLDGSSILISDTGQAVLSEGIIFTKKSAEGFIHSTTTLTNTDAVEFSADVALPTYPVGSERFLNGGEL